MPKLKLRKITIHWPVIHIPSLPGRKAASTTASRRLHPRSFLAGIILSVFVIFLPYNSWLFLHSLPNPALLTQRNIDVSTKIFDRNGLLLYEIYVDQNRTPVPLEKIPRHVIDATIAIEDRSFYRHMGFSVRGISRAAREIFVNKKIQGGSTITQQLIKSALLTPEISIIRKSKEILLAFWAERIYTKNQILEMYLNQVPYGGTAWGIESAARTYFHKSITDVTLPEAALLAGLPAAPTEYSPFGNHPEKAFARQYEVLNSMRREAMITDEEFEDALKQPIRFAPTRIPIRAPHFVMYVKEVLEDMFGPRIVERGGLRVTTSIDIALQEKAQDIVRTHIESLDRLRVGNGAAIVTNPKTGEILAMVGSRDYFDSAREGNVNVTTSLRQPGSSIKVVTYAAALENGMTAATLIDDAPVVFTAEGAPAYRPVNYDSRFHGLVPIRYALGNSYNVPAVKILATIGVPALVTKGRQMGITSWNDPSRFGLSLTLGGGEVTMLDMAKVYGTLANMGKRTELRPILSVTDYAGNMRIPIPRAQPSEAVKPQVAWILADILSDNAARTQAFGPNSSLVIPGSTVAVKTGTSNEKRDNWAAGFTPSVVAIVWVGNNDNSPMDPLLTSGITGAAPIWHDIMTELLKGRENEPFPIPPGLVSIPCYNGRNEYFLQGTEPANGRCSAFPTSSPAPRDR